jgi:hypothetical protein
MKTVSALPGSSPKNLKILIVSTPKTGNIWLRYLLSAVYDLPIIDFAMPELRDCFDYNRYHHLGPRWVAHQHFPPVSSFVRWAQDEGVVLMTSTRHPGDILVSMYHYVQNYAGRVPIDPQAVRLLFSRDTTTDRLASIPLTEGLETYVRNKFFYSLNYSIAWLASGLSYGVRYEDLWQTPVETLRALTQQIQPVPMQTIKDAVERCHIDTLRVSGEEGQPFYRAGGVGGWRASLPPAIIDLLRQLAPYPQQFKWLNYDLHVPEASDSQRPPFNSFRGQQLCDEPARDWLTAQIYRSFREKNPPRFHLKPRKGRNDFYLWLNARAEDDPGRGKITPIITNLGAYLYSGRPDLQQNFPDLYGSDRATFSHWFVEYMPLDYPQLDTRFVIPVCESWVRSPRPKFRPVHIPRRLRQSRGSIGIISLPAKVGSILWLNALIDWDPLVPLIQAYWSSTA